MNRSKKGYLTAVCILILAAVFVQSIRTYSNVSLLPLYLMLMYIISRKLQGRNLKAIAFISAVFAAAGDAVRIADGHYPEYIYYIAADLALPFLFYQTLLRSGREKTERNKAEEALRTALKKLKFHIDNSPLAYIEFDRESRVMQWSKNAEKIFGWKYDEIVGKQISDLKWVHEDDAESVGKLNFEMINARQSSNLNINRNYTKDGRVITCEWYNSVLFDPDGTMNSIFSLVLDVTDRVQQQEKIKGALQQLEQTNSELENFSYIASHDLQEPLRMVSAYTELLERKYGHILDNNGRQYLSYAGEAARRMQSLIRDLLHYTRISGRDEIHEEIDLFSIICSVTEIIRPQIIESCAKINYGRLPVITADPVLIKILFQHLISNAIKFRGKNQPEIFIESVEAENEWLFSVKDNGIGISPEYFDKIFIIFQRLHARDKFPGSGMGLPICRRIVEQHGGKIWVESDEREGSKFYFTISKQQGSLKKLPQLTDTSKL